MTYQKTYYIKKISTLKMRKNDYYIQDILILIDYDEQTNH